MEVGGVDVCGTHVMEGPQFLVRGWRERLLYVNKLGGQHTRHIRHSAYDTSSTHHRLVCAELERLLQPLDYPRHRLLPVHLKSLLLQRRRVPSRGQVDGDCKEMPSRRLLCKPAPHPHISHSHSLLLLAAPTSAIVGVTYLQIMRTKMRWV